MRLGAIAAAVAACAVASAKPHAKRYNTAATVVPGAINVHLVPHSHDDVGWLKTVDQYSQGANNTIQHANTGLTIDTVVQSLLDNPDRKFIYVEQAFFQRWYAEASEDQQDAARQLVAAGQLEFVNGGWCMHDEASPSYVDMLDNTFVGHRNIADEFGASAVPTATWQIDPFGHSSTQAALLSSPLAGFASLHFWRIDYQDRSARQNATSLETIWRASPALGTSAQAYTHIMPSYGPPNGALCWDEVACGSSEPIVDDPLNTEYNVPGFVNLTVSTAQSWASSYRADSDGTLHLLWPMGSDFQYTNAFGWYKNLDKLVHYVNQNTSSHKVNLLYSTPSIYSSYKLNQKTVWPKKTDDFFPYADGPHAMWSGYFTSRAALKGYVRDTSSVFQASKQLQFLAAPPQDMGPGNALYRLERAMGVTQHHDSVSGTSKQHVAYDYARRLAWGREDAQKANAAAFSVLTGFAGEYATCDLANATICPALESPVPGQAVLVLVYNQQAQAASNMGVRIPVSTAGVASYAVAGPNAAAVTAQVIPASPADAALRTQYYGAPATPMSWLVWQAPSVPAVGYAAFFVTPTASVEEAPETHISVPRRMLTRRAGLLGMTRTKGKDGALVGDQTLTNGVITLTISSATGMVSSYANSATGVNVPLAQSWGWYNSSVGDDAPNDGTSDQHQASGAYIFRTNSSNFLPVAAGPATVDIITGPIVNEAQQVIAAGWVTQVVSLWANQPHADFHWTVGPIPNGPAPQGKEVVARYQTNLATKGAWKTDSNVREMIPRQRDTRFSWNYTVYEPIAGNYVPVNARITTADANTGTVLSVTTDRTQGGASMIDGSVGLMVHRRLQHDDSRGVGEPLNEPGLSFNGTGLIVRGTHRLSIDPPASAAANGKAAVQALMFRPYITFSPLGATSPATWAATYKATFTGLAAPLPANVHLLTAHAQSPSQVLVRLAHLFEPGEDATLSQPATVSLTGLFQGQTLANCVELTTVGSRPLASVPVRTVQIEGEGASTWPTLPAAPNGAAQTITVAPMAIRTFMCDY